MGIEWLMLDFGAISIVVPFSSLRGSISIQRTRGLCHMTGDRRSKCGGPILLLGLESCQRG